MPTLTSRLDPSLGAYLREVWPLPGVGAGSALGHWQGRLLIVQDDAMAIALVDPQSRQIEILPVLGGGERLPKATKPDFESLITTPDGAILLLGSGSAPTRRRIARLSPADGTITIRETPALYDELTKVIGSTPNIEGAVPIRDHVRLFHRGSGRALSAAIDLPWTAVLDGDATTMAITWLDLGTICGVPLTITDATSLDGQRVLYTAAAEDTPNAVDDGPVVGTAIGLMADDRAAWTPVIEADGRPSIRKIEGILADPGGHTGWLVTDPDDPARSAELCRFELRMP